MKTYSIYLTSLIFGMSINLAHASDLTIPNTFTSGTAAVASDVNENFSAVETAVDDNDQRISNLETTVTDLESAATDLETILGSFILDNVINVALDGGDFSSVADALNSILTAAEDNQFIVKVAPGIYTETELVQVPSFVHLQGSGPGITVIRSERTGNTPSPDAATVELDEASLISDLTVQNFGTGTYGIALHSTETSTATIVDNVVAEAIGDGGTGHFAAYWNDAEAKILNSTLFAGGAVGFGTAVNTAFGSVNIANGFPQAIIENSNLIGGSNNDLINCNDPTGTGFGMQLSQSSPTVRNSYICGGHRGISSAINGNISIQSSEVRVSGTNSAFLLEISAQGSIRIANSALGIFNNNKFTGAGTGLLCVHNYNWGNYAPLSDGNTAATACN